MQSECKSSSRGKQANTEGQGSNLSAINNGRKEIDTRNVPKTSGVLYRRIPESNILVNSDLVLTDKQIVRILKKRESSKKAGRKSKYASRKAEKNKPKSVATKPFVPAPSPSVPAWYQGTIHFSRTSSSSVIEHPSIYFTERLI